MTLIFQNAIILKTLNQGNIIKAEFQRLKTQVAILRGMLIDSKNASPEWEQAEIKLREFEFWFSEGLKDKAGINGK